MSPSVGRTVSPALFLLVVGCFFLPFFTVECNTAIPEALEGLAEGLGEGQQFDFGQEDLQETVSGWQLVIGEPSEEPTPTPGRPPPQDPGPDWVAVSAFGVAVLGVAGTWLRRPAGPGLAVLLGLAGVGLLIWLLVRIGDRIPREAEPFVDLTARWGFWVAVAVFSVAALWGAARLLYEGERQPLLASRRRALPEEGERHPP